MTMLISAAHRVTEVDFVDYGADYGIINSAGHWTGSVKGILDGVRVNQTYAVCSRYSS